MSTGALMPVARLQAINSSGVMNGAKLFTYIAGSSTKKNTYSDVGLGGGSVNANPVVADSNGFFGPIYGAQGDVYKLVLAPSTDTDPPTNPVWTQDNVYLPLDTTPTTTTPILIGQGRLTLTSGTPVTTTDVSAATHVYYAPYSGNQIALFDGSSTWTVYTFAEIDTNLSGFTASTPYDFFAFNNAGTVNIQTVAWTNATTRATALTTQNGVLVKSGATTRRYLGTVYINGSGAHTDDTTAKRYVYNYYNRIFRELSVYPSSQWNYTQAVIRQANGSAANQVEVMTGFAEDTISLTNFMGASTSGAAQPTIGIGIDSTTVFTISAQCGALNLNTLSCSLTKQLTLGYHYYSMLEENVGGSGTATFYGTATGETSAFTGFVRQ